MIFNDFSIKFYDFDKQDSNGAASRRRALYYELINVLRRNEAENELEPGYGLGLGIGRNYILLKGARVRARIRARTRAQIQVHDISFQNV